MKAGRLLKVLLWIVAACCAAVAGFYLIVLYVNRHDQPPSKSVVRFEELSRKVPPVADKDNGYIYFLGFLADKELDPEAIGKQRVVWAQAQIARSDSLAMVNFPGKRDYDIAHARGVAINRLFDLCKDGNLACARALENSEEIIAEWVQRETQLGERYKKLRSYPQWRAAFQYDNRIPLGPFSALHEAQRVLLLNAWMHAGHGDAASVRKLLQEDMRFWRRNLVEADALVAKMIYVNALRRHFAWSNIIMRRLPAAKAFEAIPAEWRIPVSDAERSMLRPFIGEWRGFASTIRIARNSPVSQYDEAGFPISGFSLVTYMMRSSLQSQHTSNQFAEQTAARSDALSVSYEQLPRAAEQTRTMRAMSESGMLKDGIYNMLGNVLLDAGNFDTTKYAMRTADLEGIRRVTLLAAESRSRGVHAEKMPLQLAGSSVGSPYDGQPFAWDEKIQSLVFIGLADNEYARTSVPY